MDTCFKQVFHCKTRHGHSNFPFVSSYLPLQALVISITLAKEPACEFDSKTEPWRVLYGFSGLNARKNGIYFEPEAPLLRKFALPSRRLVVLKYVNIFLYEGVLGKYFIYMLAFSLAFLVCQPHARAMSHHNLPVLKQPQELSIKEDVVKRIRKSRHKKFKYKRFRRGG
jgi:hypothetical protein